MFKSFFIYIFLVNIFITASRDCIEIITNANVKNLNWNFIKNCLPDLLDLEVIDENVANNVWGMIRELNDGVENIPPNVFKYLEIIFSKIPIDDFMNITIDELEVVQSFGKMQTLNDDKMRVIAAKVSTEWASKTPSKYSEYDLISLGRILCYFNKTEISRIHADAYRYAAKEIGELNCPQETLKELAKLAIQYDGFGSPNKWSKFDIVRIGNVVRGLDQSDYSSINPEVLQANPKLLNMNNTKGKYNGNENKV